MVRQAVVSLAYLVCSLFVLSFEDFGGGLVSGGNARVAFVSRQCDMKRFCSKNNVFHVYKLADHAFGARRRAGTLTKGKNHY